MAVRTRRDLFECDTGLDTTQIVNCSRLVSGITGFAVQPNKAIVGANAFAHESGIHQDGVLKHRETYEIMRAEDVGWTHEPDGAGQALRAQRLPRAAGELGMTFDSEEELNLAFAASRTWRTRSTRSLTRTCRRWCTDATLDAANERSSWSRCGSARKPARRRMPMWCSPSMARRNPARPAAAVPWMPPSAPSRPSSTAAPTLKLYSVNAITSGTDAQGEVTVRLEQGGRIVNGAGADTDIVIASAKAYINAVNKIMQPRERAHPQTGDV